MDYRKELIVKPGSKVALKHIDANYHGAHESHENALPEIGKDLHAGNSTLFFWSHDCIAPWQTEQWLADMRHQVKRPAQFSAAAFLSRRRYGRPSRKIKPPQ